MGCGAARDRGSTGGRGAVPGSGEGRGSAGGWRDFRGSGEKGGSAENGGAAGARRLPRDRQCQVPRPREELEPELGPGTLTA